MCALKLGFWGVEGEDMKILCLDMVDVITCAIFGDSRLRGVGVVRGL